MRGLLTTGTALAGLLVPATALAQQRIETPVGAATAREAVTGDVPPPMPTDMPITDEQVDAALPRAEATATPSGAQVYSPEDFTRFAPRSALDMLNQVPGFDIISGDQG